MTKQNELPPTEIFYQWKEFRVVEGENEPRLLTPWANPMEYEDPMDWTFASPEQAKATKSEMAPEEDWVLVKVTYTPVELSKAETE